MNEKRAGFLLAHLYLDRPHVVSLHTRRNDNRSEKQPKRPKSGDHVESVASCPLIKIDTISFGEPVVTLAPLSYGVYQIGDV
jgi:hypothetical protein